ncbi:hypothetical protein HYD70_02985 [Mycoplasmopsis bovis]|nr:hypothetical protein HYD70_02985 [Mycoplasmopsis bovis]
MRNEWEKIPSQIKTKKKIAETKEIWKANAGRRKRFNIEGLNQDQFITYLTELQLKQSVAMQIPKEM